MTRLVNPGGTNRDGRHFKSPSKTYPLQAKSLCFDNHIDEKLTAMKTIRALLDREKANAEGRYDEFVVVGIADEDGNDLTDLFDKPRPIYPSISIFEEDLAKLVGEPVKVVETTAS